MKIAHVFFKDSKYDYMTSVSSKPSDEEIVNSFKGNTFNMGGMSYNHENDQETEVDDLQVCIECIVTKKIN